jgi:hypothetical protein
MKTHVRFGADVREIRRIFTGEKCFKQIFYTKMIQMLRPTQSFRKSSAFEAMKQTRENEADTLCARVHI